MAAQTSTIRVVADTRQAERALGNLTNSLKNLVAIGAVSALAKQFIDLGDSATVLRNKMGTVTQSSKEATQAFNNVLNIAKLTGSEVSAVGDLFQKVALAGKSMGLSLVDTTKVTENFTKALAITGTVGPAATSAIYQFGQSLGRGTVAFEDMKQLQEASAGTLELIAKQFGKTTQQFLKDVQAQRVGSRDLVAALKQLGDTVDPVFGGMQKTVSQSLNIVKTNFVQLMDNFENATGTFDKLAKGIQWLGNNLKTVVPLAAALVGAFAATKILAAITAIGRLVSAIRLIGTTGAVASALATGGISAITAAAGAAAAYLTAEAMFADMEKNEALKKQAADAKLLENNVKDASSAVQKLAYQGGIIDIPALEESAKLFGQQTVETAELLKLSRLRADQEKAVFSFAKQQGVEYEKIKNTSVAGILRADIARLQTAESMNKISIEMASLQAEMLAISKEDKLQAEGIRLAYQARKEFGESVSQQVQEQLVAEQLKLKVLTDTYNIYWQTNLALRQQKLYSSEIRTTTSEDLDVKLKILQTESQLGYRLNDNLKLEIEATEAARKRLEYLMQIKKSIEAVNRPLQGVAAGASAAGQLGQLDPTEAARTANETMFEGLQYLRNNDLINHEQYERARVNASVQAIEAITEAQNKQFQNQELLRIRSNTGNKFSLDTQKQMAADAANYQKKTDLEKTQFALQQASESLNIMGQQNKKAFEAAKAFNIANAIMNTYMGATKALATYPWPIGPIFAALTIGAGMAQVAAIRSQQYSGRQLGGPVMGGTSYIVGENGPELFTPNTTGSITRNQDAFGSAGNVNVNFTINAVDVASFDGLLVQRRGLITQIISDAMTEKGQRGI